MPKTDSPYSRYRYHSIFKHLNDWAKYLDQPEWFGDVDLTGIYPTLSAGAITVTPILLWSDVSFFGANPAYSMSRLELKYNLGQQKGIMAFNMLPRDVSRCTVCLLRKF